MATRKQAGNNVFRMLQQDHQTVTKLMNDLKKADDQQKGQLFATLQEELETHMTLEERFFYPRLEKLEELSDLIQDAIADHDDIKDILQQMNEQEVNSEEWLENCQALEDTKEDHVDREEQEVFPQVMELLDAKQISEITELIAAEKARGPKALPAKARSKQSRAHA